MTGHSGVQYDNDRQTAAATKVVENLGRRRRLTQRRERPERCSTVFLLGQETGPVQMRTRATDMFDAISEPPHCREGSDSGVRGIHAPGHEGIHRC